MKWLQFLFYFLAFFALFYLMTFEDADAKSLAKLPQARQEKSLPCDDTKTQKVHVALGRLTILSFPVKPKDILPGESSFDFKQIKNDLAIKALRPNGKTNVFVYMLERRCAFDVITVPSGGDDIIFIRDPKDKQFEVNFK